MPRYISYLHRHELEKCQLKIWKIMHFLCCAALLGNRKKNTLTTGDFTSCGVCTQSDWIQFCRIAQAGVVKVLQLPKVAGFACVHVFFLRPALAGKVSEVDWHWERISLMRCHAPLGKWLPQDDRHWIDEGNLCLRPWDAPATCTTTQHPLFTQWQVTPSAQTARNTSWKFISPVCASQPWLWEHDEPLI